MMKKRKRVLVRILNPRGEKTHTSMRRAAYMVQCGVAIYEQGRGLLLIDDTEAKRLIQARQAEAAQRLEESILSDRNGLIRWEGCNPGGRPLPRSNSPIEPKVFASPDKFSRYSRARQVA